LQVHKKNIYIYKTHIVTLIKLIKFVFGSRLVSSAAMHLVYIYILSELRPGCCKVLCLQLQLLFLYILSWLLDIICCIVLYYDAGDVLTSV